MSEWAIIALCALGIWIALVVLIWWFFHVSKDE